MRWTSHAASGSVAAIVTVLVMRSTSAAAQEPLGTRHQLPPVTDLDTALTDTLARLERRLANAALGGFRDTLEMARLVEQEDEQAIHEAVSYLVGSTTCKSRESVGSRRIRPAASSGTSSGCSSAIG